MADATGAPPEAGLNEADGASFQTALDQARLTLPGRLSHGAAPNHRGRLRPGAGRGPFAACEAGLAAGDVLAAGGLVADAPLWLDEPAGVSLPLWRRPPG